GLGVDSIWRIQLIRYGVLEFLEVETTFDIFQNIHILYLQYCVLSSSGYGVLSFIPLWYLTLFDVINGEVINELIEYENVGMLCREKAINSFNGDDLAFQCIFTYITDFVVLEDIGEFILIDKVEVVMSKPFRKINKLKYDCGPEYQVDESMKEWLIHGHVSIHEVTLYLMRRSLEVLRKFHWIILGGRFNQLSHVSSPLLSKPGEYYNWMAFGGNTCDLGSFGEETDEIMDLHQDSPRSIVLRAWRRRRRHKATSS
ncbi:hypothetical protein Tco_0505847, partial [Tanacetum coccineum]